MLLAIAFIKCFILRLSFATLQVKNLMRLLFMSHKAPTEMSKRSELRFALISTISQYRFVSQKFDHKSKYKFCY